MNAVTATLERPAQPATGADALQARQVAVRFEGLTAIEDLSLTLGRNEVLGLIGPNGAGKTTLVNVLTGFERPSAGQVVLGRRGRHAAGRRDRRARAGLARTFQGVRLFRGLSVIENLEAAAVGSGLPRAAAERRAARDPALDGPRATGVRSRRHAALWRRAAGRHRPRARDGARASCCSTSRPPGSRMPSATG